MNRRLIVVIAIVFVNLLGAGFVVPTLPLFAEGQFDASAFEAASFIAIYYIAQFIAAPLLGNLSDRIGRKPVLVWSQFGTICSFLIFIFAAPIATFLQEIGFGIFGNGLTLLAIARVLDGITGGNVTAAQAYITDVTPDDERAQALGYIHIAFALGIVFGPALGGLLAQFSFTFPFVAAAILTTISWLATVLFLPESLPPERRKRANQTRVNRYQLWRELAQDRIVLILFALAFITNFTIGSLSAVFPLFAADIAFPELRENVASRNVGLMMTYLGVIAIFTQLAIIKPMVRRYGEQNAIIFSIACAWVTCIALSFATSAQTITLALTPAGIAYAIGIPCGEALLVRYSDERLHGQLIGLYQSTLSIGYVIGPLLSGFLYDRYTPHTPFQFSFILVLSGLGLAFLLKARTIPNKRLHKVQ